MLNYRLKKIAFYLILLISLISTSCLFCLHSKLWGIHNPLYFIINNILGISIIISAIIFLIWYGFKDIKPYIILIIFLLIVSINSLWKSYELYSQIKLFQNTNNAYISLMKDIAQHKKIFPMKYDERNFGIMAPIMQWLHDYLLIMKDRYEYLNKERDEKMPNITNKLLMSINEIKRAQKSYKEARILLINLKLKVRDDYIESLEDLNNIDFPENLNKDIAIQSFKKGFKDNNRKFLEMIDLEEEKIIEIDNLLIFMISRNKQYQANKDIIIFKNKDDEYNFNEYINKIKKIEERQNYIYQNKVKKDLEHIKYMHDLGQKIKKIVP